MPGAQGGSKARSGTAATRSGSEHGEDPPFDPPEHPAIIAAGGPNTSRFPTPLQPAGSGTGNTLNYLDRKHINLRDPAHV